jgi:hypothetical protein
MIRKTAVAIQAAVTNALPAILAQVMTNVADR